MSPAAERSFPYSAFLPAALLLLFAFELGTFSTALDAWRVVVGHALIVVLALWGCRVSGDPLSLKGAHRSHAPDPRGGVRPDASRWPRLLPAILALATAVWLAASAWQSPVPRAGFEGMLLLVMVVFAVPTVVWLWRTPRRRRLGAAGIGIVLGVVAAAALVAAWREGSGRAAAPLGHHNLLALWLVMLLPLGVQGARAGDATDLRSRTERLRERIVPALAGLGAGLACVAVLATRSVGAMLAILVLIALAMGSSLRPDSRSWRLPLRLSSRLFVAALLLAVLASIGPRLADMARGDDVSARVRWGYLEAAVRGIGARPLFGWGPGAAAWTFAEHMRPVPGIHPAGEVVADPHSLPLRIAYDLGVPGLVLIGCLAFCVAGRRTQWDDGFGRAAGWGLVALLVAGTFTRPLASLAIPVGLVVLIGGRLAAAQGVRADGDEARLSKRRRRGRSWVAGLVVLASAVALAPLDAARVAYGQATHAPDAEAAAEALKRAVRLDPWHPLYRARLASIRGDSVMAHQAATEARGVAALWLAAASAAGGTSDADPETVDAQVRRQALARACGLDALAPVAPFLLAVDLGKRDASWAAALAGRAVLAEPRLLAATAWQQDPDLRDRAITWVMAQDDVDAGWRQVFLEEAAVRRPRVDQPMSADARRALVVRADTDPATAMSLHVFHRSPWPWRLADVVLDAERLVGLGLPAASALASTGRSTFDPSACVPSANGVHAVP